MELDQLRKRPAGPSAATVRGDKGGIGRASSPEAEELSDDLRRRTGPRRFCSWCLVASAASVAMVPQVIPEARAALGQMRSKRK